MKKLMTVIISLLISQCEGIYENVDDFLKAYPTSYQDIIVENKTILLGTNICPPRYELIKPILNLYNRPFSLLEIGAAQGYFSFNIAHDYPHSICTMIEGSAVIYPDRGDILGDLCYLNRHLKNIIYIKKKVDLTDFQLLNQNKHYDIIFAFLVIHQITTDFEQQKEIINNLFLLGDNVIIEVANNVDKRLTRYVESLSKERHGEFLGEVMRIYKDKNAKGTFYWFKNVDLEKNSP